MNFSYFRTNKQLSMSWPAWSRSGGTLWKMKGTLFREQRGWERSPSYRRGSGSRGLSVQGRRASSHSACSSGPAGRVLGPEIPGSHPLTALGLRTLPPGAPFTAAVALGNSASPQATSFHRPSRGGGRDRAPPSFVPRWPCCGPSPPQAALPCCWMTPPPRWGCLHSASWTGACCGVTCPPTKVEVLNPGTWLSDFTWR